MHCQGADHSKELGLLLLLLALEGQRLPPVQAEEKMLLAGSNVPWEPETLELFSPGKPA